MAPLPLMVVVVTLFAASCVTALPATLVPANDPPSPPVVPTSFNSTGYIDLDDGTGQHVLQGWAYSSDSVQAVRYAWLVAEGGEIGEKLIRYDKEEAFDIMFYDQTCFHNKLKSTRNFGMWWDDWLPNATYSGREIAEPFHRYCDQWEGPSGQKLCAAVDTQAPLWLQLRDDRTLANVQFWFEQPVLNGTQPASVWTVPSFC
jgi:hypothetical protein